MPRIKISREDAIRRIGEVFRRYGYDGASLRLIAQATGLGRASLYHHFPDGKDQMVREVFGQIGQEVEADILAPLRSDLPVEQRLQAWVEGVIRFYAGGSKNCLLGTLALGGHSDSFARELAGAFQAWVETLTNALTAADVPRLEARRRAENAVGRIQGAIILARGLKDDGHFRRVLQELPAELMNG